MRYMDPRQKLSKRRADPGTPGESFGTPDQLKWVEKEIEAAPSLKVDTNSIWDYLYLSIRNGKKFPILNAEALETMRILSAAKKGTKFA
jgi:hypothetical protein